MKELDVLVVDPQKRYAGLIGDNEAELENRTGQTMGEVVDLHIQPRTLAKIRGRIAGKMPAVGVATLQKPGNTAARLKQWLEVIKTRQVDRVVAIASNAVFNDWTIRNQVSSAADQGRFLFFVDSEKEPAKDQFLEFLENVITTTVAENDRSPAVRAGKEREHKPYLEASQSLRNENSGRLDAKRVARYFGLSERQMAKLVGVTPQAVSKTPDSKNIQEMLFAFERITRGRLLVDQDDKLFRQWLNTPSEEFRKLDGRHPTPLEVIKKGNPAAVAALVDDMLNGQPA